jgi:hypothetical protein
LLAFTWPPTLDAQDGPPSEGAATGQGVWPVEVTGFVGALVPLAELLQFQSTGLILGVPVRVTLAGKQKNSVAIGGRVSGWFSGRIGAEGTFTYSFSDLDVMRTIEIPTEPDRIQNTTAGASVWTVAVRVLYRLARIDKSAVILVGAGPAIISRGGSAFDAPALGLPGAGAVTGTTDLGGVFDLGVRIDASSRVAIRLDAEAYLYSASLSLANPIFTGGAPPASSKFQSDLVLSAGLAIGL